jgi:hypothetical protein
MYVQCCVFPINVLGYNETPLVAAYAVVMVNMVKGRQYTINVPSKLRPGDPGTYTRLTRYTSGGTHVAIEYCPVGRGSPLNCVLMSHNYDAK